MDYEESTKDSFSNGRLKKGRSPRKFFKKYEIFRRL